MSFSVKFNDQDVFEAIANLRKGIPMPDSMVEYCERDPAKAIMVALNRGARPLVDIQTKNPMEVVVQEILQDKIFLDASGNLQTAPSVPRDMDAGPSLDDL